MAGDGRGGTRLTFSVSLIPPITSPTAEFGYTATIKDGEVPLANMSMAPVRPFDNPTTKNAADSYQGGAETGAQLTAGATEIDSNVLLLADGAGQLVDGLVLLEAGAAQLNAGLARHGSARRA